VNEHLYREWVGSKCGTTQEISDFFPASGTDLPCVVCCQKECRLVLRDRLIEGKSIEAIEARVGAVPGDWLIEERPKFDGEEQRYALYAGRKEPANGIVGGWHGLNLVGLHEPDFRWKDVRPMLQNAHSDILWLLMELKKARKLLDDRYEEDRFQKSR
jgi:hypothetical protein